ncbi:hypothetical protein [Streptomyces sp. NRRL S-1813]|uniref:hypothetical protein n=1 Tax=Streptomyces sp. NRRL S-1813 TaxID=1463888 RepID=UPI0004C7EB2F|nr:hypothetical protein [Streptomyces sp. NRRL S-1813]
MSLTDVSRRLVLADAVRAEGGEWTTKRVDRTYRSAGLSVPHRKTWRDDLEHLTRDGVLTRHDAPNRRYYTRKDDAR